MTGEQEAHTLLLSIDPLAALAESQEQLRTRLQELAPAVPEELPLAWEASARATLAAPPKQPRAPKPTIPEQFAVLVTCRDEVQQIELLTRFHAEGLDCQALLSCPRGAEPNRRFSGGRRQPGTDLDRPD